MLWQVREAGWHLTGAAHVHAWWTGFLHASCQAAAGGSLARAASGKGGQEDFHVRLNMQIFTFFGLERKDLHVLYACTVHARA